MGLGLMDLASSTSLSEVPFCALDFETTQVEGRRGELAIIEIGAQRLTLAGAVGEPFEALVHPDCRIRRFDSNVSGITDAMVRGQPDFVAVSRGFFAYLGGSVIVAHNAPFDMGVLKTEGVLTGRYIDTLLVCQHVLKSESHKLQYLRYSLGLKVEGSAHDALGDIMVLEKLFEKLKTLTMEKFSLTKDESAIQKMLTLTKTPVLLDDFKFGKHRGKSFSEVAASDRGYLDWLYKSEIQKVEIQQNKNLVNTLKYYLKIST